MTKIDAALAASLDGQLEMDLERDGRLGLVRRYLVGDHDLPYMPRNARIEYKNTAAQSVTNWLPLVADTFAHGLFVDGYREPKAADNAEPWRFWQANGMDARQTVAHRGALEYGASYVLVLPGDSDAPFIRPLSPLRAAAWYEDDDDTFPVYALRRRGTTADGVRLVDVIDDVAVYTFGLDADGSTWRMLGVQEHHMGVCPVVRFRERLGEESAGIIRPLIPVQRRINEITFMSSMAMLYASFRQRWATGLVIPEDEDGNPVEPFQAAVDRLWVTDSQEARFGDFAQTDLNGHLQAYTLAIKTLAAIAQVSPTVLTGDLTNISADGLKQLEQATQRKLNEYETIFGEAWETVFWLAGVANGTPIPAGTGAQVRWRDTESRSLAATVDALGKMAEMLRVPVEGLWERIPGVTDQDIARWTALRDETETLNGLLADFGRQMGTGLTLVSGGTE